MAFIIVIDGGVDNDTQTFDSAEDAMMWYFENGDPTDGSDWEVVEIDMDIEEPDCHD